MWRLLVVSAVVALFAAPHVGAAQQIDEPVLREAIVAVVDVDTGRSAPRLPRVTIDPTGDLTIVFAIKRNGSDDPPTFVPGAMADTLNILRAVYTSDDAPRVRSTTVLGTYAVWGKYSVREIPLLRAVLTAESAQRLEWDGLSPADLPNVVDVWWMPAELSAGAATLNR